MAQEARDQVPAAAPPVRLDQDAFDRIREMAQDARDQAQAAMAAAPPVQLDQDTLDRIRDQAQAARDQSQAMRDQAQTMRDAARAPMAPYGMGSGMGGAVGVGSGAGGGMNFAYNYNLTAPMAFAQNISIAGRRGMNDDRLYDSGLRALDGHKWDEALEDFNQVASHAGARADGGWYWKAYTLSRLGRRDEALAAIAELRKSFATSRWLDESKALEIEVRQASGRPVSPEGESDEDLKLMALNGIMQSDPDRAIPLVENILKGSGSHRLKAQALFVLAQNGSPRAQQIVEQIARGGGNPDLQVKAIEYLGQRRRQSNNNQNQLLMEIYNSSNDSRVKSAILDAFRNSRDIERLGQIAKTEKNSDLRERTYNQLGEVAAQPELWQIYQAETAPDAKITILRYMHRNGNADKLVDVIKHETDPKVRRAAIDALASQESGAPERLVSVYSSEQDPQLRQAVVDSLSNQRNAKYLIDLARAEKDTKLKLRIVERLSNMHSKEASDYLLELLK
jgi:tetratricopeptide (TPR) repeat protein